MMHVIQKFSELSVSKIWSFVKESEELILFFLNYQNKQPPNRNFLFTILSTKYPDEIRKLIYEVKLNRKKNEDFDELMKIDSVIKQSIINIVTIRSKFLFIRINLAMKSHSNFFWKGSYSKEKIFCSKEIYGRYVIINKKKDNRSRNEEVKEESKEESKDMNVDRG